MQVQESKTAIKIVSELCESCRDLSKSMKGTTEGVATAKKLWRESNKSKLMSIGMTLILFPEPTPISIIIGTGIMAAGAIQEGIRSQAIYVEDIPKTLLKTFKELHEVRYDF